MHDGSLATLDDVVRHYEKGGVRRARRAARTCHATSSSPTQERADSIAFLETLSSETPPQPSTEAWVGRGQPPRASRRPSDTTVVSQVNKLFAPAHVRLRARGRR